MKLHTLSFSKQKKKKRRGRGGKRGTYSGKGIKGQKSRAGRRIRPAERDIVARMPKRRGVKNAPKQEQLQVYNVGALEKAFGAGGAKASSPSVVDIKTLKEAGLLPPRYQGEVKILGNGEIAAPIVVRGLQVSKTAREKIENAGGKVEERVPLENRKAHI